MNNKIDKSLMFVIRHYRKGRLNKKKAYRRFCKITGYKSRSIFSTPLKIAATILVVATVVFAATKGFYKQNRPVKRPTQIQMDSTNKKNHAVDTLQTASFHFNHTPVTYALEEIGKKYNAMLLPSDSTKEISGTIEVSNLSEAISVLENTLNIKITIRKR